jgi:hypothetical protein
MRNLPILASLEWEPAQNLQFADIVSMPGLGWADADTAMLD